MIHQVGFFSPVPEHIGAEYSTKSVVSMNRFDMERTLIGFSDSGRRMVISGFVTKWDCSIESTWVE